MSKNRSKTKITRKKKRKVEKSAFGLSLGATINSNLHAPSANEHALNTDFEISPSYKLTEKTTLIAALSGNKDFKGERKFELYDSYIGAVRPIHNFGHISVSALGLVFIPLSEASKLSSFKSGVFLASTFTLDMTNLYFNNFGFDFRPGVRVNFHQFETSLAGGSNTKYSLSGRFRIHYTFSDKFKMSLSNSYSRSTTYLGNTRDSYAFSQNLSYALNQAAEVSVGHSKGGSPLSANGKETEIEIFDSRSSSIYTGLSYGF